MTNTFGIQSINLYKITDLFIKCKCTVFYCLFWATVHFYCSSH